MDWGVGLRLGGEVAGKVGTDRVVSVPDSCGSL